MLAASSDLIGDTSRSDLPGRPRTMGPRLARPYGGWMARPWRVDLVLAGGVTLSLALIMAIDEMTTPLAYCFAVVLGGVMLLRRSFPRLVLVVTLVLLFSYYIVGFPPIGIAVPVVAALFSASERDHTGWAVGATVFTLTLSTAYRVWEGDESASYVLGYEMVMNVAMMAGAIALGYGVRSRRAQREQQLEIIRLSSLEQQRAADRRIQNERVEVARDLHDLVGHTMSVISLHTDVARESVGHDDQVVSEALGRIRTATSDTLSELRATVKLLRSPRTAIAEAGVVSLSGVETLVTSARAAGPTVDYEPLPSAVRLSAAVDATAYRIIQESLTNVLRHARADRVWVRVAAEADRLVVSIRDDGQGRPDQENPGAGHGIAGMTERARLLGGDLTAGPHPDGGFDVRALLPLSEDS